MNDLTYMKCSNMMWKVIYMLKMTIMKHVIIKDDIWHSIEDWNISLGNRHVMGCYGEICLGFNL